MLVLLYQSMTWPQPKKWILQFFEICLKSILQEPYLNLSKLNLTRFIAPCNWISWCVDCRTRVVSWSCRRCDIDGSLFSSSRVCNVNRLWKGIFAKTPKVLVAQEIIGTQLKSRIERKTAKRVCQQLKVFSFFEKWFIHITNSCKILMSSNYFKFIIKLGDSKT